MGIASLQELRAEYGSDPVGFYATDAFNENVPPSDDPEFLRASSAAVFGVCASLHVLLVATVDAVLVARELKNMVVAFSGRHLPASKRGFDVMLIGPVTGAGDGGWGPYSALDHAGVAVLQRGLLLEAATDPGARQVSPLESACRQIQCAAACRAQQT